MSSRSDWVKKQREEVKKIGFANFFLNILKEEWKHPQYQVFVLIFNISLYFLVFLTLKQLNFSMIYCNALYPNGTATYGDYFEVVHPWAEAVNKRNEIMSPLGHLGIDGIGNFSMNSQSGGQVDNSVTPTLNCDYNMKKWYDSYYPINIVYIAAFVLLIIGYIGQRRYEEGDEYEDNNEG